MTPPAVPTATRPTRPREVPAPIPPQGPLAVDTVPSFARVKALACPKEEKLWESMDAQAFCSNIAAVADGATRYWKSGLWARWLVSRYASLPPSRSPGANPTERWKAWLEDLCREWSTARYDLRDGPPGPWEQQKSERGSASTLLGLELGSGMWRAEWLGDPLLFHARPGYPVTHFPPTWEATDKPNFAYSLAASNAKTQAWQAVGRAKGYYGPDDLFVLTTDALAPLLLTWGADDFLKANHAEFSSQAAFAGFVRDQREAGTIPNDDSTLMILSFRDDREAISRELMRESQLRGQTNMSRSQGWYLHYLRHGEPASSTPATSGSAAPPSEKPSSSPGAP